MFDHFCTKDAPTKNEHLQAAAFLPFKNHRNSSAAEVVPAKLEPIGAQGFGSTFFLSREL
jgi:hypothetical protein